jgi:hypothetical protein
VVCASRAQPHGAPSQLQDELQSTQKHTHTHTQEAQNHDKPDTDTNKTRKPQTDMTCMITQLHMRTRGCVSA